MEGERKAKKQRGSTSIFDDVDSKQIEYLRTEAISWATIHGAIMVDDNARTSTIHTPMSLLPAVIPRSSYENMVSLAPLFNRLVDRISRDSQFINDILSGAAKTDEFTRNLLNIYNTIRAEGGPVQPICLGINRSDYMIQEKNGTPLQVELNTIAASFGCLSTKISQMHKYLISRHLSDHYNLDNLPSNNAMSGLAKAMAIASKFLNYQNSCVLMVVQENETNSSDQRLIEYELWEKHEICMIRRTLSEINDRAQLDSNKNLTIDGYNVAVVYFRAGYTPRDYPSKAQWDARLKVARSMSIKCPSVAYHLTGCKKIQQALSLPGFVEKFVDDEEGKLLRKCFAGLWGLEKDDESTKNIIAKAIATPEDYVVKPQREGGGNNLWGEEIIKFLSSASVEERSAYILMEKIKPANIRAALLREGKLKDGMCQNEIGIYATYINDGKKEHLNEFIGHLVRTKFEGTDEGGVASGYAVVNSPILK